MPYEAALSDEPWPTSRTIVASRSRAAAATRANSRSCSSSPRSACGCSRISARNCAPGSRRSGPASAGDELIASDQDPLDVEVVVQDDHVRGHVDLEPARGTLAE